MSVQDLTGTAWVFNTAIPDSAFTMVGNEWYINFSSNSNNYIILTQLFDEDYDLGKLKFNTTEVYTVALGDTEGTWQNDTYKTISITGGTDVTNADLISWLEANATMQTSQITVDMSSLSGWSNVSTGSHTLTIKAKATGYRDSVPSTGVSFTKAASGYSVEVSGTWVAHGGATFYDGQNISAPLLYETSVGDSGSFDEVLTVTSGYLYCVCHDSFNSQMGTPSGGVTFVSGYAGGALYQVTANGSITGIEAHGCFIEGTQITLADGSKKAVEDITYDDELLVWDFYKGKFDIAKPEWIMHPKEATHYNLVKFDNGAELGLVGSNGYHRIFNKEAGAFTHTGCDETPNGTTTFTQENTFTKVVSQEIIEKPVKYYNIITKNYYNLFANGILTSCRLSNKHKIADMKYVGQPLYSKAEEEAYWETIRPMQK